MTTKRNPALSAVEQETAMRQGRTQIEVTVKAFPLDGAYALGRVIDRLFPGTKMVNKVALPFGNEVNPLSFSAEPEVGKKVYVRWGRFHIPALDAFIETSADDGPRFSIEGFVRPHKAEEISNLLSSEVEKELKEHSLFKGKAVRIGGRGDMFRPSAIDLSEVKEEELLFPTETLRVVQDTIFAPLTHINAMREMQIPRKRGVLLGGKWGTGKTLTAYVAAKKAVDNGWSFFYLTNLDGLVQVLNAARFYQPVVVFVEDINEITKNGRNEGLDAVLNTLDGVDSKNTEMLFIATTNFLDQLDPAFIRPGRIDALIHVPTPDVETIEKLIRIFSRGRLGEFSDVVSLRAVASQLVGQIPAVVREVVERTKLRNHSRGLSGIYPSDLLETIEGMKEHMERLNPPSPPDPTELERFGKVVGTLIGRSVKEGIGNVF